MVNQTGYAILGILAIHPNQSGYEIRKTVQQTVGFFWGESYGQIYPTLKLLLAEGLITASGARAKGQEYSIAPAGQKLLQEWLAVPYRESPQRDEFLLKIFFGAEAAHGVSAAQIRRFQERNRKLLAELLALREGAQKHGSQFPGFPFWMLTLQYGLDQLNSALQWSEHALAMLPEVEEPAKKREAKKHSPPLKD
jgi:DNA-binding PadR family transcriptional regulator